MFFPQTNDLRHSGVNTGGISNSHGDTVLVLLPRVRKLKETLVTVQQLDKNMSNLRTWLSCIEAELSKPVVYVTCRSEEIQQKLSEQQVSMNLSPLTTVYFYTVVYVNLRR